MEDKLKKQPAKSGDLSDIVLEKEKKSDVDKTKKLLLFAAMLILLFLVALVLMKLFNKGTPMENNLAQVGEHMAQPVDKSIDKLSKKVQETNDLFQQEPIIDDSAETDLKFEEMVRRLKAQESGESTPEPKTETVAAKPKAAATPATNVTKPKTVVKETTSPKDLFEKKADEIAKSVAKTKSAATTKITKAKEEAAKIIETKIVKPAAKPKPKRVVNPPKEIIVDTKVSPVEPATKLSSLSGYFIQVGATTASFPDRRFLQKIKDAGYDYIVHSTVVRGKKIKKVLIGPFASRSEAKRKLPGVHATINPSAFIYRIH